MKKNCLSILCTLALVPLFAQTPLIQNGLVREQNSGKRPIADVQIIFANAVPTTSEQSGKFRLAFSGKKAGDLVFMTEITKTGYELVNDKELEHLTLTNSDRLPTDIIVAKAGVVDAAKKQYYAISDIALKTGFERQKAQLRQALQNAKMTQQQFQDQFDALQKQYDNQKKVIDELSEKFAKVNFDDVSALYQEALQLFKDGKIDQAIQKLEGANLNKQTAKIIKESNAIDAAEKSLAERKAVLEKTKKQQIETIQLLAQLYATQFKIDSAEAQYDQLLLLDSTNLDILRGCADFYKDNHRYEKALRWYPFIIAHPEAKNWQIANAYAFMGDLYTNIGDLNKAMADYTKCSETYTLLSKNDPTNRFYKANLAISSSKIGDSHTALGNIKQAWLYYENTFHAFKELHELYPKDIEIENGLAKSYTNLGSIHTTLGNLDKAMYFNNTALNLSKHIYELQPNNVYYKNQLAASYHLLGNTQKDLGNSEKALGFYEESYRLEKELYQGNTNDITNKESFAISCQSLGNAYGALGNLVKALQFYEVYNNLEKELLEAYPLNSGFKDGLAVSYAKLGSTYRDMNNSIKAIESYLEYNRLEMELCESYPYNIEYKLNLGWSNQFLGIIYTTIKELDKALEFYEKMYEIFNNLYKKHPNNVKFKYGLGISYSKLDEIYTQFGNLNKSLEFRDKEILFFKELTESYPDNAEYKKRLAITFIKLAFSQLEIDKQKAKDNLKEAEKNFTQLHDLSPQNIEYILFLDNIRLILKDL